MGAASDLCDDRREEAEVDGWWERAIGEDEESVLLMGKGAGSDDDDGLCRDRGVDDDPLLR